MPPRIPPTVSARRVLQAPPGSNVSTTAPLASTVHSAPRSARAPMVTDATRQLANAFVSPDTTVPRAPKNARMENSATNASSIAPSVDPVRRVIISMDSVCAPPDSREPCAPDRAPPVSGETDVGRCAGVRRNSNSAMRRLESAVVRQDSKETDAINRAKTATTDRIVSKSVNVRERRPRRVIVYQERVTVIPDSPESFVMHYAPNPHLA